MENELITVSYDEEQRPYVMGRDLYEALGIGANYMNWFPRMCEYGFQEGRDFITILLESTGGRPGVDHQLTIEMAKEICMIQRTDIGKQCREYFLQIERKWNEPEAVMARALQMANRQMTLLKEQNRALIADKAVLTQQVSELQPKATYYDTVLSCKDALPISVIAKDYGWSAKQMNRFLNDKGVQYKLNGTWLLYSKYADRGYTKTVTYAYDTYDGDAHANVFTKWTQAGRLFIYELMTAAGYPPLMERELPD